MTKCEFFEHLAKSVIRSENADSDALILMAVLHNYCLHLTPETILSDAGDHRVLMPLTRNHASEIVASCFPKSDRIRADPGSWHSSYVRTIPTGFVTNFPFEIQAEIRSVLDRLIELRLIAGYHEDE